MHLFLIGQTVQISPQYENRQPNDLYQLYVFVGIVIVVVAYFFIRRFINNHRGSAIENAVEGEPIVAVNSDSSILMTMYTLGVGLTKVSSGTMQNYNYTIFITSPINTTTNDGDDKDNDNDPDDDSIDAGVDDSLNFGKYDNWEMGGMGRIRYSGPKNSDAPIDAGEIRTPTDQILIKIDLPVKSQVHIAGFSLQDSVFKNLLGNTNINYIMTKVALEGDFPDYFKIYCQNDKEVEIREVLDPSTMAYLVDFCSQLNWELFENNLYFVQSGTNRHISDNNVGVLKGAEDFVTKILPTLTRMIETATPDTPESNTPLISNQPSIPTHSTTQ